MFQRFSKSDFAQRLRIFFESHEAPYSLALLRMLLPLVLLVSVIPRWWHVRELYSSDGSPTPLWNAYGQFDLFPVFSPAVAVALYALLMMCLVTACIGWKTRLSLLAVTLLYPYFGLLDALGTTTKYVVIASHLTLLLACSDCGHVWSVDAWLLNQQSDKPVKPRRSVIWPRRLIQILIGVVYLGAAATKMQTPSFFNGDQLSYWMLTNVNFPNPVGEYLSLYPVIILAFGFATVVWEILFLFLVWRGYARWCMLGIGLIFHTLTILTLGLLIFPLLFMVCYVAFLEESEARRIGEWCQARWNRICGGLFKNLSPLPLQSLGSWTGYLTMVALFATICVTTEAQMDVYGEHRPTGRHTLTPLSAEDVQRLLRNDTQIHPQDAVFSLDLGTVLVSGLIANDRTLFAQDEVAIVQTRLVSPHDDMWLEVTLRDADGLVIKRLGQVAPREESKVHFEFPMEVLTPGEYAFVLQVNGQDAHHRKFRVK